MELTLDEYLVKEAEFFVKLNEYKEKLVKINRLEPELSYKNCDKLRQKLAKNYEGYTDICRVGFCTEMTEEYVSKFPDKTTLAVWNFITKNKGKKFKMQDKVGTLNRVMVYLDDYCYELIGDEKLLVPVNFHLEEV